MSPSGEDIRNLRMRYKITQKELAESLYDIKEARISEWERGVRNCPGIVWWAMILTWDKVDIYGDPE